MCSPVNVVDDDIALEGEESLQVNLSLPRGSQLLLGETTVANITISDDDGEPNTHRSYCITYHYGCHLHVVHNAWFPTHNLVDLL